MDDEVQPVIPLRGRALRLVLLDQLRWRREASVDELARALSAAGLPIEGRPSKAVSDALRWEVRAGRVARVRRGMYRFTSAPRSRLRRASLLARASSHWASTPALAGPRPPWADLQWLWSR